MRAASAELIALLAGQQFIMADLFTITLKDHPTTPTILRYTTYDANLTVSNSSFIAVGPFLERSRVRWIGGVEVDSLEITIKTNSDIIINNIAVPYFARDGGFDGARVLLERLFMPSDSNTSITPMHLFSGRVADVQASRHEVVLEVLSDLELLNISMPRNMYQASCRHTLYDAGCGLNRLDFDVAGTVTSGSTTRIINCSFNNPAGFFDLGTVRFNDGPNANVTRTIKRYTPGVMELSYPVRTAPANGNSITGFPGCDRLQATCTTKFNNLGNFAAMPYIPVAEMAR